MKILLLYATTEGQTLRIARRIQRRIAEAGHMTELLAFEAASDLALPDYDGALLMGSVHAGQYQQPLADFVRDNVTALMNIPHVFISVSLSAAGDDPDDWAGLESCVARLSEATDWVPRQIEHVAGAFRFSDYNWFKTWAMRWIASQKGQDVKSGEDIELTDWDAVEKFVDKWLVALAA